MECIEQSLLIRISQINGRNMTTNYALELIFWVVLGLYVLNKFGAFKK